ncbi:energy-coupling factor ABC transporter substrate-binding protein [Mycoplasma sp. P36-A1]|uniref:energy-coupling factor ABC transporter substrate-binding protein n=1 Tax=Mycoplasma sp. P36-A1 TaxID=3252900 RepID=UPI003C2C34FB
MNKKITYPILIIAAILLIMIPLVQLSGNEFVGTDDQAVEAITQLNQTYTPWFDNIFDISDEMESIFFTLQATIGAFVLGIALGRISSKKNTNEE